jgi:hypothetical protein
VTRIEPVQSPYTPEVAQRLEAMMPPGAPPILLFRTFVRNLPMAEAMGEWGRYELSRRLSVSMRDREIVIDRTCARAGCEYEWGVHVAFFAERVGLTDQQVSSLTHGSAADPCWATDRERLRCASRRRRCRRSTLGRAVGGIRRWRAPRSDHALRLVPRHQLHGQMCPGVSRAGSPDLRLLRCAVNPHRRRAPQSWSCNRGPCSARKLSASSIPTRCPLSIRVWYARLPAAAFWTMMSRL